MQMLKFFLFAAFVSSVSCKCTNTSLLYSSYKIATCLEQPYISKLKVRYHNHRSFILEKTECCSPKSYWDKEEESFDYHNWFFRVEAFWYLCPNGYFLMDFWGENQDFNEISMFCVKPVTHPRYYDECFVEDVIDLRNNFFCSRGEFITGFQKKKGNRGDFDIEKIACCNMMQKRDEIHSFKDLQERIMDTNYKNMDDLGNHLGFVGCEKNVEICNVFVTVSKYFYLDPSSEFGEKYTQCPTHCFRTPKINYSNWRLAFKTIKYGELATGDLQTETVDSGTIYNRANVPVTESFEISRTISDTVTHTKSDTTTEMFEGSVKFELDVPLKHFEGTASYTLRYDTSDTETVQDETFNSKTYTKHSRITLEPMTAARYNVIVSKSKTTVNYTATIIAAFSVEFAGYLRTGGRSKGNKHHLYQHDTKEKYFTYSFGDHNVPFYKALKTEFENQNTPWLWKEMNETSPVEFASLIHSLTDEKQYEIELKGNLETVSGTNIDVVWEIVPLD